MDNSKPPRLLTADERIQARHLLQVLMEHARSARNVIEPYTGIIRITDESWIGQWVALKRDLDAFTEQVRQGGGKPSAPYSLGDRNA